MSHPHRPLHELEQIGPVITGGRLIYREQGWALSNAHGQIALIINAPGPQEPLRAGALARVEGRWDGQRLHVTRVITQSAQRDAREQPQAKLHTTVARAQLYHRVRRFFDQRGFLEVQTPCWVMEPGTDLHLDPFRSFYSPHPEPQRADADAQPITQGQIRLGYLQTSPEFAMKALLSEGYERIYQLTRAWRNGEITALHQPEFTILEWYRAWEPMELLMDEVEALTRQLLEGQALVGTGATPQSVDLSEPFTRMTMQELCMWSCGIDLLECLSFERLKEAMSEQLPELRIGRAQTWDELFFQLQISALDPFLEQLGAVFITHWPRPLAVLAQADEDDPRVAQRFELYIAGVELANGFYELTDPREQRGRFVDDLRERRARRLPDLPMPERFLEALERGIPPSSGVAMGVERLLMLRTGAATIQEVVHQGLKRT